MNAAAPIKRSPHIAALSRDHHHSLLLGWKIRQGIRNHVDISRISAYVQFFYEAHVKQHFEAEETLLFSKLAEEDELRKRAVSEHQSLHALFGSAIGKSANYAQFNLLADLLDQHIRFEERILFPHIEKSISATELQQVGETLSGKETITEEVWKDAFWKR